MNWFLLGLVIFQIIVNNPANSHFDSKELMELLKSQSQPESQIQVQIQSSQVQAELQPPSLPQLQPASQPQTSGDAPSGSFPVPPTATNVSQSQAPDSVTIFPILNPSANRPTVRPPPGPGYPYPYPTPTISPQDVQVNLIDLSRRVNRLESLNELWKENFMTMRENFRRLLRRVNALSE